MCWVDCASGAKYNGNYDPKCLMACVYCEYCKGASITVVKVVIYRDVTWENCITSGVKKSLGVEWIRFKFNPTS